MSENTAKGKIYFFKSSSNLFRRYASNTR